MTKGEAIQHIAARIRGCFGSVDLNFALHPSDGKTAKELKNLVKDHSISRSEIDHVIRPILKEWLEKSYYKFNSNTPGPFSEAH